MTNSANVLAKRLRLHTIRGCTNNIWVAVALHVLLIGVDFMVLLIPNWTIALGSSLLSASATVSLCGFYYWIYRFWDGLSTGMKIFETLESFALLFIVFVNVYVSGHVLLSL